MLQHFFDRKAGVTYLHLKTGCYGYRYSQDLLHGIQSIQFTSVGLGLMEGLCERIFFFFLRTIIVNSFALTISLYF